MSMSLWRIKVFKKLTDTGLAILGHIVFGLLPAGFILFNACDLEGVDFYGFIPAFMCLASAIMAIRRRWKH
jgi:hypothetical protein